MENKKGASCLNMGVGHFFRLALLARYDGRGTHIFLVCNQYVF